MQISRKCFAYLTFPCPQFTCLCFSSHLAGPGRRNVSRKYFPCGFIFNTRAAFMLYLAKSFLGQAAPASTLESFAAATTACPIDSLYLRKQNRGKCMHVAQAPGSRKANIWGTFTLARFEKWLPPSRLYSTGRCSLKD